MKRLCIVAALLVTGAVFAWNDAHSIWYLRSTNPIGEVSYIHGPNGPIDEPHCREFITGLESWRNWRPAPDDPENKTQYACTRITLLAAWMGRYIDVTTKTPIRPPWETPYIFGAALAIALALLWPLKRQPLSAAAGGEPVSDTDPAPITRAGFGATGTWRRPYGSAQAQHGRK